MTIHAQRKQQPGRPLREIFNHFARDSIKRFPVLKGQLLVFDTNERASYGRDDLNLKKAGYSSAAIDTFLKKRTAPAKAETYADWGNKLNLQFILYNERISIKEWDKLSPKAEKDILFILDHELAHLVIKDPPLEGENKQYKDAVKEAIADAYALIRHYQRYGADSEHRNSIIDPWARAAALTLNKDKGHFSTFMLDEIIKCKDDLDFDKLSPHQTAALATRFALEYTPPSSIVNRAVKKLKPVYKAHEESPGSNEWLKLLAEITLDPKTDYHTFRICSKTLQGYLDGRTDMDGKSVKATGEFWDKVRENLTEAEVKFGQEGILFNMPLVKDRKPRPANQNKPKL